ncbi:hypothetical protein EYF80_019996 [Liparis tanakae]|uniref:Uncharacterized protein n=1 Tax=Liparis tanakae TaxID=230148 RepID=A0A4Z2HXL2_9TELE|nr:hypothetical protein EYF80_019996 [Liparis tanakae]
MGTVWAMKALSVAGAEVQCSLSIPFHSLLPFLVSFCPYRKLGAALVGAVRDGEGGARRHATVTARAGEEEVMGGGREERREEMICILRVEVYLSSFIVACKLADDSIVSGKVLHEDGRDFSEGGGSLGRVGQTQHQHHDRNLVLTRFLALAATADGEVTVLGGGGGEGGGGGGGADRWRRCLSWRLAVRSPTPGRLRLLLFGPLANEFSEAEDECWLSESELINALLLGLLARIRPACSELSEAEVTPRGRFDVVLFLVDLVDLISASDSSLEIRAALDHCCALAGVAKAAAAAPSGLFLLIVLLEVLIRCFNVFASVAKAAAAPSGLFLLLIVLLEVLIRCFNRFAGVAEAAAAPSGLFLLILLIVLLEVLIRCFNEFAGVAEAAAAAPSGLFLRILLIEVLIRCFNEFAGMAKTAAAAPSGRFLLILLLKAEACTSARSSPLESQGYRLLPSLAAELHELLILRCTRFRNDKGVEGFRLIPASAVQSEYSLDLLSATSGTTTLRLQACRSRSVAIWLRGAFWCICRTPSTCPLRRRPTLGGDCTSARSFTDTATRDHIASIQQLLGSICLKQLDKTLAAYRYLYVACSVLVPRQGPVPQLALLVLLPLPISDGLVQKGAAPYRNLIVLRSLLADHLLHDLAIT